MGEGKVSNAHSTCATFLFTAEIAQMLTEVRCCINIKGLDFTKMREILAMAHDEGEMNIVHRSGAGQSWLH